MKQYNINPQVVQLSFGPLNCLSLGEAGRGRRLLIVPVQSGLLETDHVKIAPTQSGKIKIIRDDSQNPPAGWIARISTCGVYTKYTYGNVFVYKDQKENRQARILGGGYGAEGAAGRLCRWMDWLLEVQPWTLLRVQEHGGYKRPPYFLYFQEDSVIKMTESEFCAGIDADILDFTYNPDDYTESFKNLNI